MNNADIGRITVNGLQILVVRPPEQAHEIGKAARRELLVPENDYLAVNQSLPNLRFLRRGQGVQVHIFDFRADQRRYRPHRDGFECHAVPFSRERRFDTAIFGRGARRVNGQCNLAGDAIGNSVASPR